MKTVNDLLHTMEFRLNQSELARALDVNRGTLRRYMTDIKGEFHCIRVFNGKPQLMSLTYKAKRTEK